MTTYSKKWVEGKVEDHELLDALIKEASYGEGELETLRSELNIIKDVVSNLLVDSPNKDQIAAFYGYNKEK